MNNYQSQVARGTPFDNSTNGYVSTNVQDAILESLSTSIERARFTILCAYNATANTGRWLEWFQSVPSDTNPFVYPRDSVIKELSLSVRSSATVTIRLFKNGIQVQDISLVSSKAATLTSLSLPFAALDELSMRVTSGTCSKPVLFIFSELS